MGRPQQHDRTTILDCARRLSAERGPQRLTIAAVAERAGAPIGSIYHRYASRDEIAAAVWLDLVERFQRSFLAELAAEDPLEAGLGAVRFTCSWVRDHPSEARLMLLHRRDDFAADRWPPTYRRRAQKLAATAAETLEGYAKRLLGRTGPRALRKVRFILVDLPTAALKRDVEAGDPPSREIEALLLETCEHALRAGGGRARRRSS